MNKHQSVYVNTIFLLLIFGFAAANVIRPQKERSETENRSLQKRPALTWDSLFAGEFADDYENYLSDQFILRDSWITLKTAAEKASLKQETDDVCFGKDSFLIEKHTGVFTSDTAVQNILRLQTFIGNICGQYGAEHVSCMIIPNAVDILRDKLPPYADVYDEELYLEKLRSVIPEDVWVDVSSVLRTWQDTGSQAPENVRAADGSSPDFTQLYYRTDHHWKTAAAYLAFQEWMKQKQTADVSKDEFIVTTVTDSFEGTISSRLGITGKADSIERFDRAVPFDYYLVYNQSEDIRNSFYRDSFLDTKDKYAYFYGGNFGLIETKMPDAQTGRRLLIIKDSYAHCFAPFTCGYYDEVDMVDPRYYNASISELMENKEYTDVLFLFNAAGFAEETALARLLV